MTPTFIALGYSPWSEKARWALDHSGAAYREVEYLPMLGVPWLRLKLRRWRGKVSVPALVDGRTILMDSFDIARHVAAADFIGPEVERWNALSEAMLAAGRGRTMRRVASDHDALIESLPKRFPKALRAPLKPVGQLGVRYLTRKYGADGSDAAYLETLRGGLETLRKALEEGEHLVGGRFTHADIAMAVAVQFIKPVDRRWIDVGGRASERCWTEPELAAAYPEVFAWRDALYDRYR